MGDPTRRNVALSAVGVSMTAALGASASAAEAQVAVEATPREAYLFLYRPGPAWRAGVPMREQGLAPHGAYIQRLQAEGRLFAGGGFVNADGGMAIVLAANLEEAEALLAADPAIISGIFVADLRHWRPRFRGTMPLP